MDQRKTKLHTHLLMLLLTCFWTFDVITVSEAVEKTGQVFLLCAKYLCALPVLLVFVWITEGIRLPEKADLPVLVLSTLAGDVAYFYFEYTSMKYLPAGTVTVLLCLIPAASHLADCAVYKRKPRGSVLFFIFLLFLGLCAVVPGAGTSGSLTGILSVLMCAVCWIVYGFAVRSLAKKYSTAQITLSQQVLAILFMLPFAVNGRPGSLPLRDILICIVAAGLLSDGFGFLIEVRGMTALGPTATGVYLNLLPVFTAVAGFFFLGEKMTPLQISGSAVVIVCGTAVLILTAKDESPAG